jgi:hypothetical protein
MALEGLKLKAAQRRQAAYDKAINSPVDYVREEALRQYREDSWQAHRFDAALLRKALAEARKAERTFDTRTCQICGRAIKASSGLIAHHGYERPGWGYQTTSCLGARYEPFERSADRLRQVIQDLEGGQLIRDRARVAELAAAPASLEYRRKVKGSGRYVRRSYVYDYETVTVERPASFDNAAEIFYPAEGTYEYQLISARGAAAQALRDLEAFLSWQNGRLAAWKAAR